MKPSERRVLLRYLRWIANELELRDWTLELSRDPAPDGAYGYVLETYGRKLAVIQLCPEFRELDPKKQRHTIAHELVHLLFASSTNMVLNDLEEYLGKPGDQIFWNGYRRQIEYGVDAIALALAKHLPLIDWPGSPATNGRRS